VRAGPLHRLPISGTLAAGPADRWPADRWPL